MAWDWTASAATGVAAVAGVFFTWLAGAQGRDQVERLARHTEETARKQQLVHERRDAYFALLRVGELNLRRRRYARRGMQAELEQTYATGVRVQMEMDAVIAVETYGSPEARRLLREWGDAVTRDDEQGMRAAYQAMNDLARQELAQ
ncbi:hypothetical protein ACWGKQ_15925 [Streptomyces sp. NPDC054770]